MSRIHTWLLCALLACTILRPAPSWAHDVDGPDDCQRSLRDFGDAPENIPAYIGVVGHFPTCLSPSAPGTLEFKCGPISSNPGLTGYVVHTTPVTGIHYWLGCSASAAPLGIDSEGDGKVNSTGAGNPSACSATTIADCTENAFGLTFGQDECYGDDDAGLAAPPVLHTCSNSTVTFRAYSCSPVAIQVHLNILIDLNHDGDWNDNVYCNLPGGCAFEWAVKNAVITLLPGCNTITSPAFLVGSNAVESWMRISISDQAVNDDFPWAGSATMAGGELQGGETEDYPLTILADIGGCPNGYNDFGDAPENLPAYPSGVLGHFPTCIEPSAPGAAEQTCTTGDPPPGPTGYVEHTTLATDQTKVSLGCGDPLAAGLAVDGEADGKVNLTGAGNPSNCQPAVITDATETAFGGMIFGQDEKFGDADAGVDPVTFAAFTPATVSFKTFVCGPSVDGYLNILVDMNEDGDWNDSFLCGTQCANEWAVRNALLALPSGCLAHTSPSFLIGPRGGHGWMRVSVTLQPVPPDFEWNGSAGLPGGAFQGGETEDYPVEIAPPSCDLSYRDFGDAPEDFPATSTFIGNYPTCTAGIAPAGGQEIECGAALSTAPPSGAMAGFVEHIVTATSPYHFWFGCGPNPAFGVDDESDGKSSFGGPHSQCGEIPVDCIESTFGLNFGQDECYGDGDAGLASPVAFRACSTATLRYRAYACDHPQEAYLNVLVDWSQDGDWNDNIICGPIGAGGRCAPEWVVKNVKVTLNAGCNSYTTPQFQVGHKTGNTWMRMTLTADPVPDDFPWNGSLSTPNHAFNAGETEDYPVTIYSPTTDVGFVAPSTGTWFAAPAPNPGVRSTLLRFGLASETRVSLTVYDLFGRRIAGLADGAYAAGPHAIEWDYRNASGLRVPSGMYLMKLAAGGKVLTQRAIVGR